MGVAWAEQVTVTLKAADSLADGMLLTKEETVNIPNLQPGLYYIFKVKVDRCMEWIINMSSCCIKLCAGAGLE